MKRKKVLVCGATGFIGRNIVERLSQLKNFEIIAVRNKSPSYTVSNATWVQCDLTNKSDVDHLVQGCDIIVQAAATTSGVKDIVERPYIHVTDNAIINSNLLRASFDHSIEHFLFFSCSVMYQSDREPIPESAFDPNVEILPSYFGVGWTKVYIEKMCEFYARLGKTKFTILRNSNIFGPYDKYDENKSHFFGATINKIFSTDSEYITVWGDGKSQRDLLYVSDLVDLVESALQQQSSRLELVNAGCGESRSITDIVSRIVALSGTKKKLRYDTSKPSIDSRICLDIRHAKRTFDWAPRVPLDEGITRTIAWYKRNILQNDAK
jgi:GDP-L-fucose synthase